MKRKLDHDDVPKEVLEASEDVVKNGVVSFTDLGLDPRLLQGVLKEKYSKPTLVQAKAIPLALEGKDILARAKTGSGKTATYLLPILHSILKRKAGETPQNSTSALILVPTRELAEQVYRAVSSLSAFCAKDIRAVNLTPRITDAVQRSLLAEAPDIVIATPARASTNVINGALSLDKLRHLVIDEADLVLSYGYDEDLPRVAHSIPQGVQTFLMSATLSNDVDTLKGLFCRDPVTLKLDDGDEEGSGVTQYIVKCGEDEKFLLIYVIFKLKLVKGKTIVFVGDIDRCYRLKLYLEQFGLRSCVLNSELPVNSRIHVVEEFNKNVYDIIIATDENEIVSDEHDERDYHADDPIVPAAPSDPSLTAAEDTTQPPQELDSAVTPSLAPKKKRKPPKKDKEYGVSRGIDFRNVACVLNFDLPSSARAYTHRIGRTARAGATGMALSFVVPPSLYYKHKPTTFPTAATDEAVLEKIVRQQKRLSREVKPYAFDMAQLAAFRYRMDDALRAVTRVAVREARTRELRQELLKSEKLKRHFEENPGDLQSLRHDGELRAAKVQKHLRHVPGYLLPEGGAKAVGGDVGFVSLNKLGGEKGTRARNKYKKSIGGKGGKGGKKGGKKVDVLKTFRKRS